MISLRLLSGFSVGSIPAAASSGRVSSRIRPLERAMVSMVLARHAANLRPQQLQLLFDALVTTVDVVNAINQGVALGNQCRDHQAGRRSQVGGHDRCALETFDASDDGGVAFDLDLR